MTIVSSLLCTMTLLGACNDNNDEQRYNIPPESPAPGMELTSQDVRVLTSTANRAQELAVSYASYSTNDNMSPSTIKIDASTTYQSIDGFGAALTGSTCYNLMKMDAEARHKFLVETFSATEGYGFSYTRVPIGCSDYSLSDYTCCDKEGIENFALTDEEAKYVIPILKEVLAINPDLKIMGSPWTAPRWMKVNNLTELEPVNTWTSGQLNPKYYQDYAQYFVKWINAFKAEGINIYSVTPQNEPLNRGNSASMYMPWEQELDFVKTAMGPAFKAAGLSTKIYAFDHNYNYDNIEDQKSYPLHIYADAEAASYLSGAAYHNYGGNRNELNVIHNAAPDKELVFSETTIGTWNDGQNLQARLCDDMEEVLLGTVNNWCKAVVVWNLMLDENKGPYRPGGCSTGYGAVDISNAYTTITRNSHYLMLATACAAVKPAAVRIGTTGYTASGLYYTAFRNADGSYALVASNSGSSEQKFTIDDGTNHFSCSMPAKSVASFSWK